MVALQYGQYDLLNTATLQYKSACVDEVRRRSSSLPTAFSSMMPWAFVFAADMAAGFAREAKNLRRNEMLGNRMVGLIRCGLIYLFRGIQGFIT